jgi:hypothetical protein
MYEFFITHLGLGMFWFVAKYTLLFFVLSLVLLVVCKKWRLFKRKYRIWDILTSVYYIYIPVVFVGFAMFYSLAGYVRQETLALIDRAAQPISSYVALYLEKVPVVQYKNLSVPTLKNQLVAFLDKGHGELAQNAPAVFKSLPEPVKFWLMESFASVIIEKTNAKVAGMAGVDEIALAKIWEQEVLSLVKSSRITAFLSEKVENVIGGYQRLLVWILFFLLLLPATETVFAKWVERRGRISAA